MHQMHIYLSVCMSYVVLLCECKMHLNRAITKNSDTLLKAHYNSVIGKVIWGPRILVL